MNAFPNWLNNVVKDFGHQFGLETFALNDQGVAGLEFENGFRLTLEYGVSSLVISLRIAMTTTPENIQGLLAMSHYGNSSYPIRSYYLNKTGEGGCAMVIPDEQVSVNNLESAFRNLWNCLNYLKGNL